MIHEIILASSNAHKVSEMKDLFFSKDFKIVGAPEKLEVIEDGKSFFENALLKAKAYSKKYKKPALADDSGLCVEALPDKLGLETARYGGEGLSDRQRWELLLKEMSSVPAEKRQAYFCCVLCFYFSDDEIYYFEGRVQGVISEQGQEGEGGFGYDPVFLPEELGGKSLAEDTKWKMENSHRSKAFEHANKFFKNYKF